MDDRKPEDKRPETEQLAPEDLPAGLPAGKGIRDVRSDFKVPDGSDFGGKPLGLDETDVVERVKKPEGLLSGEWLQNMTEQEMLYTIAALVFELRSRMGTLTEEIAKIPPDIASFSISTDRPALELTSENFVRLPAAPAQREPADEESDVAWRFILLSPDPTKSLLRLEVHDDIVIGRAVEDNPMPNLDLSDYGSASPGVSRRHALLRPTREGLFLIDLGSTNGTYHNQHRLLPRSAQQVSDEDIISFANLHFKIMIVRQPG